MMRIVRKTIIGRELDNICLQKANKFNSFFVWIAYAYTFTNKNQHILNNSELNANANYWEFLVVYKGTYMNDTKLTGCKLQHLIKNAYWY